MKEIEFGYADVGELTLHFARAGSGEGLVLLLHGFPEFWYSWRHQIEALSDQYTVVAPDLRGYNLSDKPPDRSDYEIGHLVSDIVGLIHHFGRDKAAVIGHDWGASIAWAVAAMRPEMLWKLGALQVPPIPVWKRNQSAKQFLASWYMFFFQLPFLPELRLRFNNYTGLADALRTSTVEPNIFGEEEISHYVASWSQPGATTAMLNYYRANILKRLFSMGEPPSRIQVPTLFIYGERDTAILPATVLGVGDMVDGPYTEHRIQGAGHWVQQEAADEVTAVIQRFLAH